MQYGCFFVVSERFLGNTILCYRAPATSHNCSIMLNNSHMDSMQLKSGNNIISDFSMPSCLDRRRAVASRPLGPAVIDPCLRFESDSPINAACHLQRFTFPEAILAKAPLFGSTKPKNRASPDGV